MPDATITSTASTFGTISGTFSSDQSTVTGTISGVVTGTLTGSVGVPGPAGPGVPTGGTTGQVLAKVNGVDYNTEWVNASGGTWGTITGTLSNQTDLQTALNLKAPLASPALTGVPTAPTAATLTSTTQLATTAFVQQELAAGTAVAKNLEVYVRNQSGSTIPAGSIVYISGATGNRPLITLAQANNDANSAQTIGFVKTSIANNGFGYVIVRGELENIDTSALTEGVQLYLSPTTAGAWTTTKPSAPEHLVYVGIVIRSHPTLGVILVAVQNGYELNELHDVAISSPTNGQVLKYDSATSLWKNATDSAGVAWGGITGTLSSQTDLQSALDGKYSTSNPSGYITSAALSGYATESWVTAGFYPLTGNPSGFITSSALTPYLTSATAASTYQTLAGMSSYLTTSAAASTYLTQSNAASTYQTISGMSSYLTTSAAASTYAALAGATFSGLVTFNGTTGVAAKSIGIFKSYLSGSESTDFTEQYNDGFRVVSSGSTVARLSASGLLLPSGGITFSDASTQTTAGVSAATVAATYAPLASPALTGNPTAPTPATADNDTSIATTAFVKAQGYLTSAPVTSVAGKTGAVTLVVGDVSGAAPLASPALTGTPTAPTATTGTNTTQVATTAFVQQEVPAASTTAAGKVELATLAEIITGTDTGRVMPVSQIPVTTASPYLRSLAAMNNTSISGSGVATPGSGHGFARESYLNSAAAGRACFALGFVGIPNASASFHTANWAQINFSNKIVISGTTVFGISGFTGNANTCIYVTLGGYSSNTTGDMTQKGIGIKRVGGTGSAIQLIVHNGTSQTAVSTSSTPATAESVNWTIYSDGTGNVTLYINGSQAATTSAGPTGTNTAGNSVYREQVECAAGSGANHSLHSVGGWVYIRP